MSRHLSPEWLAGLDAAVRGMTVGEWPPIVVEQRVTAADGGDDVVYRLVSADGGVRIRTGPGDTPADVVITQDGETAAAIARGELNALEALQAGRITIDGDADRLRSAVALLTAVSDATASLRAATDHPPETPDARRGADRRERGPRRPR